MLSGIALIAVTTFAVWGAYCIAELLAQCLQRPQKTPNCVVVLRACTTEEMWNGVLDVRAKLPDSTVVVLGNEAVALQCLEPSLRGVFFATADTLNQVVCRQLAADFPPCARTQPDAQDRTEEKEIVDG